MKQVIRQIETHRKTDAFTYSKNGKSIEIKILVILTICILSLHVYCQETQKDDSIKTNSPFITIDKQGVFKPVVGIETWATYSIDEGKNEVKHTDRQNVMLRRFRFGANGNPYAWLQYHFQLHFDRLGEDNFASTKGSFSGIGIWNAYVTAKLLKKNDLLFLHAGYYWAAISREYNTSAWTQGSLDRTRANWYMRKFLTGRGNGIESGIGIGGLKNFDNFGISYRVGSFGPQAYASSKYSNRLYTGHVLFSIGEAESKSYKYRLPGNNWRKRKGVTIGFGGATQSNGKLTDTTFFNTSVAYGADVLISYSGLRIDGEYFMFKRNAKGFEDFLGTEWHIRIGYSFILWNRYLEPVICYDEYNGEGEKALYNSIGEDKTMDIGVNWYLNKDKLKLAFHYLVQQGSVSSNNGDYACLAFQCRI